MRNLYIDSSSMIRIVTGEHDAHRLMMIVKAAIRAKASIVSSRLLALEAERVAVRMETVEGKDGSSVRQFVKSVTTYPITEELWSEAASISQHIKTLDSIHVATALFVPECEMLTSDDNMRKVASSLGIAMAEHSAGQ